MGCCGCSLAASALAAVVLGLVESIVGMCWNIVVIVVVQTSNRTMTSVPSVEDLESTSFPPSTLLPDEEEMEATILPIDDDSLNRSDWETFKMTLISDKAIHNAHILELSIAALVLNSLWLITTLAMAVGNAEKCRGMLKPWIFTTIIVTISDIAATVYFIFKAVEDTGGESDIVIQRLFVDNIFVIAATLFSRGGPVLWVANVALCIYVAQRIKEIELLKKKRMPFDADLRITPYSLHPPYEAYEADSYRCEKSMRPSTPPPDYEAFQKRANGGPRKMNFRRQSLPSECDNSTLPISIRSGSTAYRPASACYAFDDDRVELQHRTSAVAAANQHVYENKALQLDQAEGWMGIPRPTLKISR